MELKIASQANYMSMYICGRMGRWGVFIMRLRIRFKRLNPTVTHSRNSIKNTMVSCLAFNYWHGPERFRKLSQLLHANLWNITFVIWDAIVVIMTSYWPRWRRKSPASRLFTQLFIQAQIKENIKAPRHWPLCGEFTGTGEFPTQRASNAENVSIWWRHHEWTPFQWMPHWPGMI